MKAVLLFCCSISCWLLLQCTSIGHSDKPIVEDPVSKTVEEWRDTLVLTTVIGCEEIAAVTFIAPAYDTIIISIVFKDTLMKNRVIQINDIRSDQTRVAYCTPTHLVLSSACGGACWMNTVVFFEEQYPVRSYEYAQRVIGAPDLIIHRANGMDDFEQMTVENIKTGKKALLERYDCTCFQDEKLTMDRIYLEEDSLVFICDRDYGGEKIKRMAYEDLK
ncbi:MAG: hypothetical protein ACRBFS_19790 [Aureispira sp.]